MAIPSYVLAASGAVPALVAMAIVDRLDAKRPEPRSTRWLVTAFGALSAIPALIIELVLQKTVALQLGPQITYQGSSFQAFAVAAAVEEACKIFVVYWIAWRRPEFDERMDGIVYASRAGLGFALVENVMYLLDTHSLRGFATVWVMRAVLAVPGHAMWTGMIGAMAARRRFDGRGLGLVGGYLLAVAFHGAYDMCVFVQTPLTFEAHDGLVQLALPVLVGMTALAFFTLRSMARTALRLDDADADADAARLAAATAMPLQA